VEDVKYPLDHEWHVAINNHATVLREKNDTWPKFMYDAKQMAQEVPRMAKLFKLERTDGFTSTHQQCSHSELVPVEDNHLKCCLGIKTAECPHLKALEKINDVERCNMDDVDVAKAWTCAGHIVSEGGDMMNEGYLLTVDDLMFWDNLHESLAAGMNESDDLT